MKNIFLSICLIAGTFLIGQNSVKNTTVMTNCSSCSGLDTWNVSAVWHPTITFSNYGFARDLQTSNYAFNIPTSATIVGIEVNLQYTTNFTAPFNLVDTLASLLKGGVVAGTSKHSQTATYHSSVVAMVNLGGSTDLWGTTWTPTDINASGFGFNLKMFANQPNTQMKIWQGLIITVYYSNATGQIESQTGISNLGGAKIINKEFHLVDINFQENLILDVYDLNGKQFIHVNTRDSQTISLSHLANGIYFYRLSNDQKSVSRKFVID